jgi:hypothetical protein
MADERTNLDTIAGILAPTIVSASISISSSGDNTIFTPTIGKSFRIRHIIMLAASSVAVILKSGSTALTGAMTMIDYVDNEIPYLFAGGLNEAFKINLGANVVVTGFVLYYEV